MGNEDSKKIRVEEARPTTPQKQMCISPQKEKKPTNPASRSQSPEKMIHTPPPSSPTKNEEKVLFTLTSPPSSSKTHRLTPRGRRLSALSRRRQKKDLLFLEGENICEIWHAPPNPDLTHVQKTALRPLEELETVDGKRVDRPTNFRGAPLVTTFIRNAVGCASGVWSMIRAAEVAFPDMRMVDREHP